MSFEVALILIAIVVLIILSAFFNGSETALTAASRARMHALEQEGNSRARLVNKLLSNPERMIGAVLLGNTLVDVLASALAASLAVTLVGDVGVVYASILMTVLIVIFAAVLPKTYALASPDRTALWVAPIMKAIIWLLTPVTITIQFVVRQIFKLTPNKVDDAANILAAHEEIRGTIELQAQEGAVARGDAKMLGGVLDLGDLVVADIMVHRTKMETVNIEETPDRILDEVLKSQYTRVPLWRDEPDNIVGILHTKDLLAALSRNGWDAARLDIKSFAQPPWFVPDTTSVKSQLNAFLKKKMQMAVVVDEYGEVKGLITLEDILEEIVGQIADEHDTGESAIRPQVDGSVNVDGTIAVRDLNRHMDWSLPEEEATTIAGLVIHAAETIPEPGQAFTFYGYRFEILRKNRNKLTALRIKPLATSEDTPAEPKARTKANGRRSTDPDPMEAG
jgi:Mg2+/Co2+ transporter CorB